MRTVFTKNITHNIRARLLLCFLILIVSISNVKAQREYKHDFSMGYGLVTSNQVFDVASDILKIVVLPGAYNVSNSQYYGGFSINYKYSLSEHWNAGTIFSFDKVIKDVYSLNNKVGDLNRNYYTFAGEIDLRYFKKEIFQMYSSVGLGYTFIRDRYMPRTEEEVTKHASGFVNFQLSLLGIRLGKDLAFFTEIGFGYKGLLNFGFSYQF